MLKVYAAELAPGLEGEKPGAFATDGKTFLKVQCGDQALNLKEVQLEGKRKMAVDEFLRGYKMILA
jgi:methionyl-tRNA formyltransferase